MSITALEIKKLRKRLQDLIEAEIAVAHNPTSFTVKEVRRISQRRLDDYIDSLSPRKKSS